MPILHDDRFIGRVDPIMDRKHEQLKINAVYVEPDATKSEDTARVAANIIEELGRFLGTEQILYSRRCSCGMEKCALLRNIKRNRLPIVPISSLSVFLRLKTVLFNWLSFRLGVLEVFP